MSGKLYLIPTPVCEGELSVVAPKVRETVESLRHFVVEDERSAQKFLKRLRRDFPLTECRFWELSEHTPVAEVKKIFEEVRSGETGLLSEAGLPCIADPGAELVRLAQEAGLAVVPLAGASSITLALMASGLNGQNFAFNGYLPKDKDERVKRLKLLEQRSRQEDQTQIIMETPYRNAALVAELLEVLEPRTHLCVALELTGPQESIRTMTVQQWRRQGFVCPKAPAMFLLLKTA